MLIAFDWQPIAALSIVVAAAAWLGSRAVLFCRNARSGRGSCHGCGAAGGRAPGAGAKRPLVQIGGRPRPQDRQGESRREIR